MCELLGMSANVPTDICFSFSGLVQRGGGTGPHKDGWGITFYEGKGCRTFKDPQPSFQSPIAKLVQEFYDRFTIVKSTPFYLEILKKTANKGIAVTHLAEKLGLSKEETMAIGDEENDRAMLEVVGSPVVMENGNPELKKIAKHITKSNDESGVAYAIRKWVLE